ncbi:uncharacterized protein STEHIDRAFT_166957 [Stereum hirsutum FP-91666 SS1]|uniref:uncharacterized protein n=1 Tax=Stereum hirsutum (strain FP-91666) TaxID=721885 RepID=UPI000440C892|nr:uncharacterized protein STEHIDRAFT_166957 [Stereum hirsutum FP-91666 SS1]EIM89025.1 hypothetical protein STEHIDRAFT_166957 [Stereum hirsutum FP-91666 SS1]
MALQAVKRFRMRELTTLPRLIQPGVPHIPPASQTTYTDFFTKGSKSTKGKQQANEPMYPHYTTPVSALNPFIPLKNPSTGRWAPAKYSLRRQADLVKNARKSGTLHLLPPGPKFNPEGQRLKDKILVGEMQAALAVRAARKSTTDAPSATGGASATTTTNVSGLTKVVSTLSRRQKRLRLGRPVVTWNLLFRTHVRGWDREIRWGGELKAKEVKGADVGNRLYAGKRRMFKGHKWERVRGERMKMQARMLRFMPARVAKYKGQRLRRKPNPLRPASGLGRTKLPF